MGKLLCLELYNFKSYKGHHVLQFGDSYFTSIIGPNGSGKSNSMDAISFVLGIKSSHLRSAHLKDLVYRGRVLKHSKINADGTATETTNGEVNGDGEVEEAPVASQRNDPRDAYVVAVYEDDAGDEQRWKRTITSSGQSEYRINNRQVTAKQYNEALEAENILIKARNFLVFQGDVEAIASQNAKDLTRLIEQISGSLDYKNEYERLKLEKERADEDQADKLNTRRGINGEIKAYREQKDELDRFEAKRKEKDAATVTHVLWKLFHFQRTIEDSTAEIQKHNAELAEYKRNVQKYETSLEEVKKDHAKVGREVTKVERELKRKEKEVEEKENELVPIDEKLSTHRKNVQTYQKRIAEIAETRDSQQQSADKLQKDLTKVENAQKRWQEEWTAQQKQTGRELTEQDLQEYQRLSAEVYKQSGNDRAKIDTNTRQLKTDEETVNSLKSKLDATQAQVGDLESDIQGLTERQNELNRTAKTTAKEIHVKKNALNALSSERDINAQKQRDMEEKWQALARKLTEAQDSQRESRKEANQRETVAQMKRIFPGVRGMVHQLCKPKQKRFENAIVTALGRHWDAVIVDSEKTAKECIQYLRDQRISRMAFIPLDTIIHTPPNANLRGIHQGTRLAIDAIDFENNLERAMGFVCGNTLVTDTVDIAKHLCYERNVEAKAVALDGTIIHRGGNMTGGAEPNDKRRQFAENELENMRVQEQKLRADLEALPKNHKRQAEEEALKSELIGFETKLSYTQDELKTLERNILSKTKELTFLQKQLKEVQRKHDEQSQGVENMRAELEEEREKLASIEDRIFAQFCQRLGYADIREYEKQQGSLQQEAEQRKQEFTKQISKLRNQISFEKERLQGTKKRITDVEAASKRDSDKIVGLEEAKEQINEDLEALNAEIDELNEKLTEQQQALEKREEKVTEARRELQKRSKNVENTLKEIATLDAEIQKASSGRYATLKSCQMESIELPLEEGSRKLETLPLDQAVLGEEEDDEDAMDVDGEPAEPRVNDYGIHVDFEELEEELQEDDSEKMDAELAEKISNLQSELEKMQPNMRSAERLNQTNVRLQGVEKEFDESRSAAKKATREFEKVKNKRMDLFNKAFKHISEQIQPVYAELTKTSSFPLGGQASLDVEDDNEPYLSGVKYHAMPPLKRFRDMEHLSGGEKTMAALALLFAIHTYAPSPFFVLDEVDAALDNANTSQLAQYVRDHAGPGMQFVVISLKTGLFQNSETLVGIMRDQAVNSSRALTLDLRKYQAV